MDKPENIYEAIEFMIDGNVHRYNRKQIGLILRPTKLVETVKAWLSKCISGESDVHFSPGDIDTICEITGRADILLTYLCDRFGFEVPNKRPENLSLENEVLILRQAAKEHGVDVEKYIEGHKDLFLVHFKKQSDSDQ